jgi:hypothetical protein
VGSQTSGGSSLKRVPRPDKRNRNAKSLSHNRPEATAGVTTFGNTGAQVEELRMVKTKQFILNQTYDVLFQDINNSVAIVRERPIPT